MKLSGSTRYGDSTRLTALRGCTANTQGLRRHRSSDLSNIHGTDNFGRIKLLLRDVRHAHSNSCKQAAVNCRARTLCLACLRKLHKALHIRKGKRSGLLHMPPDLQHWWTLHPRRHMTAC